MHTDEDIANEIFYWEYVVVLLEIDRLREYNEEEV